MTRIAVVGMACRYPDASSPTELWENALAGRRAFRRLPDVRMRLADYWDADPATPDRFYARNAAVIEGYEFDRLAYKIAGSTYRSTDLTHWLALDMAGLALADAGFPAAEGLPRERTAVVVGNTLTGEFSRANVLRLRWPYVRRTVAAALQAEGWTDARLAEFLDGLEASYKSAFPPVDEDTLAGGLANTIAGRICNHFDLKGGGYTVDGACSSSLLSVATACKALIDGEVDVAIAGGVDLSIDPFEIIGFAKTGALARREFRLYDRGSNGFWPGEGCGMVVLMREQDATAAGHRSYANIAGWGISSDGKGGITRPEVAGYKLALQTEDDQATVQVGAQAATKLSSNPQVVGVLGTLNTSVAQSVQPVLAQKKIAQISPANTNPTLTQGTDFVTSKKRPFDTYFRVCTTDAVQGPFAANYLVNKAGKKSIATISDGKTYGVGLVDEFTKQATKLGAKVVANEKVGEKDTDFGGVIAKIRGSNPDAVYYGGEYPNAGPLSKQLKAAGLNIPLMGGDGIFDPKFVELG
ncbi:MAG: beta-ketoacyl synthase N-terminal-like domain-containing protein, partial [Pseudonocardiaceae bacterium]